MSEKRSVLKARLGLCGWIEDLEDSSEITEECLEGKQAELVSPSKCNGSFLVPTFDYQIGVKTYVLEDYRRHLDEESVCSALNKLRHALFDEIDDALKNHASNLGIQWVPAYGLGD